jgi:hypothetical protein
MFTAQSQENQGGLRQITQSPMSPYEAKRLKKQQEGVLPPQLEQQPAQ